MRTRVTQRVLLVIVAAVVAAGGAIPASGAGSVSIKVSSALGSKILVTSSGLTLYHYTAEKRGAIACLDACAKLWLPLVATVGAKPQAGPGLTAAKLGTIKRPDGKLQVTYNGLALYHYASDKAAGQTKGQGLDGKWFAVTAAGAVTKGATGKSSGSTSGSTPTGGGGASGVTAGGGTSSPLPSVKCDPNVTVMDPNDPCYNTAH